MNLLEITVQRGAVGRWPVVAFAEDGKGLRVRIQTDLQLDPTEVLAASANVKSYGALLGHALFRDELREALTHARDDSEDGVRVLLYVEADDLRELRWERLCSPADTRWDHLLLDQKTPFTLYLPTGDNRRFPPIGKTDLRALLMVSSPTGLGSYQLSPFDAAAVASRISHSLEGMPCDVLAPTDIALGPPTLDALCAQITTTPYAVLHVVCHGRYIRSAHGGDAVIYLCHDDGTVDAVSATRLIERLRRLRGPRGLPRLTFLASCESATGDIADAHGGLAQRLIGELGMPAVIAMTDRVSLETASALSAAFYNLVRRHGEIDRALAEATAGLAERSDITVPALYSRLRAHPLFTESLDHPLEPADVEVGLVRATALVPERAPVLGERFRSAARVVRASAAAGADSSMAPTREDQEQALADLDTLCDEVFDVSFHGLALGHEPPPYDSRCPFRGLYPFHLEDREFFFGREALTRRLVDRLKAERFLAVLGASGSGKSSLVLAGLIPALLEQDLTLVWRSINPGADPLRVLDNVLATADVSLVIIDQFEEVFTLCTDAGRQRAFIERVCELAEVRMVILTMRADFWGECAPYHELRNLMQRHQELIAPMDAIELRRAVESQAEKVRLRFEAELINTILDDLEGEPGSMPLLQHALGELWKRRHGQWLRADEYRALGGVREAIARTADNVYERLSATEQERMRDIFIRLTRFDVDALPGEPRRDTRRRVALEELVPAGTDPADTRALVARIADADSRLVVTSLDPSAANDEVEVAHEALIRYWPRLRTWLDENHSDIRLREAIRRAALEWEESEQNESLLTFRGTRLEAALHLAGRPRALNEQELRFVNACQTLRIRELAEDEAQRELISNQEAAARLRDLAQRIERDLQSRPMEALARAVAAVGDNLRQLPNQILAPVASSLHLAVELARERALVAGHHAAVTSVAFAADGRLLASGSDDGSIRLWDRSGHAVGKPLRGHLGRVLAVAFSPDHSVLVSAGEDRSVRLWHLAGEQPARVLARHADDVTAVAFALDGRGVVSESDDGSVRVWDADGTNRLDLTIDAGLPMSLAVSKDGRLVAIGSDRGQIRLLHLTPWWDHDQASRDIHLAEPFADAHDGLVTSLAFAARGDTIASGGDDGTVRLWTLDGRAVGERYTGHEGAVMAVAFSPDGDVVASGGADDTLRLSDRRGRQVCEPFRGHTDYVLSVAFDPAGMLIASGSADRTLHLWDRFGHELRGPLEGHESHVNSVAVSPDGRLIVSGSADRHLRFWRPDGTDARKPLKAHDDFVYSVAIAANGSAVASAGADGTAKLWNIEGELVADPLPHPEMVSRVAFSPDDSSLVTVCGDGSLRRWSRDGAPLGTARGLHEGAALVCVYSPDGNVVVSGGLDGFLRLWNLTRDDVSEPIKAHDGGVTCLAFDMATGGFVSGGLDGTLRRWDEAGNAIGTPLRAHEGGMRCVAICDDTMVTGGHDGTLRLWHLDGAPIGHPLRGHRGTVWSVATAPDGSVLASGGADWTVRLWRGTSWRSWLRIACERLEGHRGSVMPDADPWRTAFAVCDESNKSIDGATA